MKRKTYDLRMRRHSDPWTTVTGCSGVSREFCRGYLAAMASIYTSNPMAFRAVDAETEEVVDERSQRRSPTAEGATP